MKIDVKTYQQFCSIPTGQTSTEQNKKLAELIGLDKDLSYDVIQKKIEEWLTTLVMTTKEVKHVKLGKQWYCVDKDLYKLTFNQFIYFDDTMRGTDNKNVYQYIHNILATFLRPCRFYKFFPRKFDVSRIEDITKEVLKMDIGVALNLINFFFLYTTRSMNNTRIEYLEKLNRVAWDRTTE